MTRLMKDSGIEWIGDIPENWGVMFAFQIFEQVKNKNTGTKDSNLLSLSYGKIKRKNIDTVEGLLPENFENYNVIDKDDIVLRLTDLQNDHKSLRVGLAEEKGIITSAYTTLRNKSDSIPKYLYYFLHAFDVSKGFYGMGSGVRQGLNWEELKHLLILSPMAGEQRRIVELINNQSELIENIIEKTRASIEEYKKLKQAIITQAVTKGIHDNRSTKESEIEWVGEIPETWKALKTGYLFKERVRTPDKNSKPLSLSQTDGLVPTDEMKESSLKTSTYEGWKQVRLNDLVLNRFKGHLGVLYSAWIEGMVSFHYGVYEPQTELYTKYYEYLYHSDSYKAVLGLKSNGMTIGLQNLSNQNFYSVMSLYPPYKEQKEIATFLDQECTKIDALISKKEALITELENYKKSMIYEYVTGKKEA